MAGCVQGFALTGEERGHTGEMPFPPSPRPVSLRLKVILKEETYLFFLKRILDKATIRTFVLQISRLPPSVQQRALGLSVPILTYEQDSGDAAALTSWPSWEQETF